MAVRSPVERPFRQGLSRIGPRCGGQIPAAMSERDWAPSKETARPRRTPTRAPRRRRRRSRSTASTRPPAVTRSPSPASAVPAWMTCTSGSASASSTPVIDVAGGRRLGVARARHHHRDGGAGLPHRRRDLGERAGRGAHQQRRQRGVEQRQERLGLRVAEAGVELDHPRAARGQREAGVEQPGERRAAAGQLVDGRLQHVAQHLVDQAGRRPRAAACRRPCRRCWGRRRRRRSA